MKKPKFIILSPSKNEPSGGMVVLYHLKRKLEDLNFDVKMQHWRDNTKITSDLDTTVVIYPEIINHNPTNAKHVVRWILNRPGVIGGNPSNYGENDLIYLFNEYFGYNKPNNGILRLIDYKWDLWVEGNTEKDIEYAHYIGKSVKYYPHNGFNIHKKNSLDLSFRLHNYNEAAKILKRVKYFYSYDLMTFWSIAASMCGATSVVIPKEKESYHYISKEDFYSYRPSCRYSVAYGEDEIERVNSEKHLLLNSLKEIEEKGNQQVEKLIRDCTEKINKE